MKIVVPIREPDGSNYEEVRLALAAVLLGENVVVERVRAEVRYRLPDGSVRFFLFGDKDVKS